MELVTKRGFLIWCCFFLGSGSLWAQVSIEERLSQMEDSIKSLRIQFGQIQGDPALQGTRLTSRTYSGDGRTLLYIGGYVNAYFAHFSDSGGRGGFQKFPTSNPRSNQLGLDMAMLSAHVSHPDVRASIGLHWGDIAISAWDPDFNMIQEANAGVRLAPRLWIDAGFFRTHIGLESIQPRENVCQSIALVTYFEPYYLSGAKLSWQFLPRWTLQAQVFNRFNGFIGTSGPKSPGLSVLYEEQDRLSLTSNLLVCPRAPGLEATQSFVYWNTYGYFRLRNWLIGAEANVGMGQSGKKSDWMASAKVSLRKQWSGRHFSYGRLEFYRDPNELLTGPILNANHQLIGLQAEGLTMGWEWRPIPSGHLRLESRGLYTREDEKIFSFYSHSSDFRLEIVAAMGVWF